MKTNQFTAHGKLSDKGQLMISNRKEMEAFFKQWPGKAVTMSFEVIDAKGRQAALAYYHGTLLPGFQAALYERGTRLSTNNVEETIRKISISAKGTRDGKEVILELSEMTGPQIWNLIEETREFVSKEFDEVI